MRRILIIAGAAALRAGGQPCDPPFVAHDVGGGVLAPTIYAADFDADGDADILMPNFDGPMLLWRNLGGDPPAFAPETIDPLAGWSFDAAPTDVDADGDTDTFATFYNGLVWYENTGGPADQWGRHEIATSIRLDPHAIVSTEIDRAGGIDTAVIFADSDEASLVWWASDGAAAPSFTEHIIATDLPSGTSLTAGDADGDGDADLVVGSWHADAGVLAWFENDGGSPPAFTRRDLIDDGWGDHAAIADFDGDGDPDIAATTHTTLTFFENVGGSPAQFVPHPIAGVGFANGMLAADLDADDRPDLVGSGTAVYRNLGGRPPVFARCELSEGGVGVAVADIDLDLDLDIVTRDPAHFAVWLENPLCLADFTGDGVVDSRDVLAYMNAFVSGDPRADTDRNGFVDSRDFIAFLNLWVRGCA